MRCETIILEFHREAIHNTNRIEQRANISIDGLTGGGCRYSGI